MYGRIQEISRELGRSPFGSRRAFSQEEYLLFVSSAPPVGTEKNFPPTSPRVPLEPLILYFNGNRKSHTDAQGHSRFSLQELLGRYHAVPGRIENVEQSIPSVGYCFQSKGERRYEVTLSLLLPNHLVFPGTIYADGFLTSSSPLPEVPAVSTVILGFDDTEKLVSRARIPQEAILRRKTPDLEEQISIPGIVLVKSDVALAIHTPGKQIHPVAFVYAGASKPE